MLHRILEHGDNPLPGASRPWLSLMEAEGIRQAETRHADTVIRDANDSSILICEAGALCFSSIWSATSIVVVLAGMGPQLSSFALLAKPLQ